MISRCCGSGKPSRVGLVLWGTGGHVQKPSDFSEMARLGGRPLGTPDSRAAAEREELHAVTVIEIIAGIGCLRRPLP